MPHTYPTAGSSSANTAHPSPLTIRSFPAPWLSSSSPDLASPANLSASPPPLTATEQAELLRPKHMNESYTSFDLPLASNRELFERYVNTSGGFRTFLVQSRRLLFLTEMSQVWASYSSVRSLLRSRFIASFDRLRFSCRSGFPGRCNILPTLSSSPSYLSGWYHANKLPTRGIGSRWPLPRHSQR